jgi:hypothetical protein
VIVTLVVSCPTHGDTTQWYNNPSVQFTWDAVDGAVGYSYIFDQSPKTVPAETVTTTGTSGNVKATGDGQWYFHVRAKTDIWGGVTTFPVRIDTTAPAAFQPKLDQSVVTVEDQGVVRFVTTDAASGIDHYEMKLVAAGDGDAGTLFVESSSPVTLQQQPAGKYSVVVRAIDRAGNIAEGTVSFNIIGAGVPFYARVPLLQNPAVANITLLILIVLVILVVGILLWRRFRVRETFQHDLHLLERDAQRKSEALQRELAQLREAQDVFAAQASAAQTIAPNVQAAPTASPEVPPQPQQPPMVQPPSQQVQPPATPIPTIFQ